MAPSNRVEITDRDGWRKAFPLEKPLLYIGSDAGSDIVLELQRGGGVAPRHLQLISTARGAAGAQGLAYRAINLGDRDISVGQSGGRSLAPRSAMSLADGDTLRLGDFSLVFHLAAAPSLAAPAREATAAAPAARLHRPETGAPVAEAAHPAIPASEARPGHPVVGVAEPSPHISVQLSLPHSAVEPDRPLEGLITVSNAGEEPGVQFRLEVEGLHPDCYEIGPGPILFPHVEKTVYFRLHHPRGPAMAAGRHEVRIRVSAPDAYPGEVASASGDIEILPYHRHTLALVEVEG